MPTEETNSQEYSFDFHVHTKYSIDCYSEPEKVLKSAVKKNITAIAITDHNTIKGGLKAKACHHENITVIVGSEIMTDIGEVIGLFLNEEIQGYAYEEVCDEIKSQDGIVLLPHPYRNRNPGVMVSRVDLIEGLNARSSRESNIKARDLAEKNGIPCVSGSDAHTIYEIGRVRTIYSRNDIDLESNSLRRDLIINKSKIYGLESPKIVKTMSRGIGRYKKEGLEGLVKSTYKIISRKNDYENANYKRK